MEQLIEQLVREIQELQLARDAQTKEMENLKASVAEKEAQIEAKKAELLDKMDANIWREYDVDDLNATVFERENIAYKDEAAVLIYLKENYPQFVKTKLTESIDKTPLKKEIKLNEGLARALDAMTEKTSTRYVVVTTSENHEKMLGYINSGK